MHVTAIYDSAADSLREAPTKLKAQLYELPAELRGHDMGDAAVTRFSHGSVDDALQAKLAQSGAEDAFFVADLGEVYRQYAQWAKLLPRVQPFFAVKCNPDALVIKLLARLGAGFDCASKGELTQVLSEGVSSRNIIYAHPCKPASHLRYAAAQGVELMTFDNADELEKISELHQGAKAVLRILADDSSALCRLGLKFGAEPSSAAALLRTAIKLGVQVVGVSFHVGSGCKSEAAFSDAVERVRRVFDQADALGLQLSLLDVGGGFPGRNDPAGLDFDVVARVLSAAIDRHFPQDAYAHVRVIAEPGRYFVASAFSLAVNVVARRRIEGEGAESFMYYVNDGVYGSFNCIVFDHQSPRPRLLHSRGELLDTTAAPLFKSSIWGPTCDSIDCIVPNGLLLPELRIGDWLVFDNMGAYTLCAASRFNGFKLSDIVYVDSERALL
ncbi:Ornithine decarboxylase [Coemansia aciculifera]|uniref:ornithine decarboxylase n=1 Tax=Coemansia pectinata TaxID=1052879 RepID=A0A9W8L9X1_9FUNG|nr:Ornithine decarboxylase [Coemansia pectinata]KAJ2882943.1 Ornithine decarboxylase [Coemansia aciculifera]